MLKLFSSKTSPFARKVRIVILEKGLVDQVEEIFVETTALAPDPDLMRHNPLGQIPCLICEDGTMVVDSRVICQYLDREMDGQGPTFHPSGNTRHKTLMALMDGALNASVLMAYEKRLREGALYFEDYVEGQWLKVKNTLHYVEREYMDMLDRMNMGEIGLLCLLEYLDFRFNERNWREIVPELAKWHDSNKSRASFAETRPFI